MPKAFATLLLLAVLALLSPGRAVAGPPEGVSGKMVLDEVADGLRKYRKEREEGRRIERLTALAATRDPRVAVVLGELFERGLLVARAVGPDAGVAANVLLHLHYVPGGGDAMAILDWWAKNEADLRRRAKQLPQ